jgi:hypothetical protein
MKFGWTYENEILQGRLAMLGVIAMIGAYLYSGQVIPGIW